MSYTTVVKGGRSRICHDLHCDICGHIESSVVVVDHRYPACKKCGATMDWTPAGFHADCFGTPQYSDATGEYHTSQRHKEQRMKEIGLATTGQPYYVKGDKEHGARPDLSIKKTGFSYSGQKSRISTAER